jgi:hypothetical protein
LLIVAGMGPESYSRRVGRLFYRAFFKAYLMMFKGKWKTRFPILVLVSSIFLITSCPENPRAIDVQTQPMMVSRGIIKASLIRYIETGSSAPFEQFSLMGMFLRYDMDETNTVDSLLNENENEIDLALDSCTPPVRVLDESHLEEPKSRAGIELLDVGNLSVSFSKMTKPVPTRTFPDLLRVIVGVIYSVDETQGVNFRPGEIYSLKATGTNEVAPFRVALEAPEDLGDVKVDGATPGDQVPFIRKGEDIELTWEGDGYGDEVMAVLTWTSMGAPWSMTCRMRDDGFFVVPSVITGDLPDPLTCSDGDLTVTRIRQVAFRSEDLSSGFFRFQVSTNFPVTF